MSFWNEAMIKHSKRGSSAVFLCIVLSTLIAVTLTMVYAARWKAVDSFADGVTDLGSASVLSEFDYYVQRDYGLLLLQGNDRQISRKLRNYLSYSLDVLDGVSVDRCTASGSRYNVINVDMIGDQIVTYVKTVGIADVVRQKTANDTDPDSADPRPKHALRHGPTIVSLPSRQIPDKSIIQKAEAAAESLKHPEAVFHGGTRKYMIDSYILSHFNSDTTTAADDHFFRDEVEYLLCGKLADEENIKKTDLALKALRFPSNLAHIYEDPEKWSAVVTAAETITPGLLGTVTQAGIAAAWATAESFNDVKLLHAGYKVPLVKDATSWAIDLDGLLNKTTDNLFLPDVNKGKTYPDYLRILLFIQDDDIKTARILDLIQINMRRNYDADFLIQECSLGIAIQSVVNGNEHVFDKIY
ncbi:MAG: hypothetical protein IJI74_07815 [Firmicutes bacterium]|nr:hypothetical protein [Bacillota bacterium]